MKANFTAKDIIEYLTGYLEDQGLYNDFLVKAEDEQSIDADALEEIIEFILGSDDADLKMAIIETI